MKWLKVMIRVFLNEPLWFKILVTVTFIASIVLSNSIFSNHAYLQGCSKLAAAIFFCAYGIKFRGNFRTALLFFSCAVICIYLSIVSIF
jgi:hypothetical protein